MIIDSKNKLKEKFQSEIDEWAIFYELEIAGEETIDLIDTLIAVLEKNDISVRKLPPYTEDEDGFYN